jgi:hypothetical protein
MNSRDAEMCDRLRTRFEEYEETLRHLYTQRRTPAEWVFADITPSDGGEYQKPEKLSDSSLKSQPGPTTG